MPGTPDDWTPTDEEAEAAGDCLLEALISQTFQLEIRDGGQRAPIVGDLVVETSSWSLDWERLGYLIAIEEEPETSYHIWGVGGRLIQWRNASIARVGAPRTRLRNLPYPTLKQLEER